MLSHHMRELLEDYLHACSPNGTVREIELTKAKVEGEIEALEHDRERLKWWMTPLPLDATTRAAIDNARSAEAGGGARLDVGMTTRVQNDAAVQ